MGKLRRIRKHSHRRYKTPKTNKQDEQNYHKQELLECAWFTNLPYEFQFHLRDLDDSVKPSIETFTHIFNLLEKESAFRHQWNLIKHSQSFLMLCNFSTDKNVTPAVKRTIIVNTNLTWKVIIGHKNINGEMQIPKVLRHAGDFVYLFSLVDAFVLCTGICDYDLMTLALSGNRCGTFKDRHGNLKVQLLDGDTIRPINCSGVVQGISGVLCEACKSYRHSLLAILSKELRLSTSSKHEPPMKSTTQVNSHCPWKRLSEQERRERARNCTLERQKSSKKIALLERNCLQFQGK